MGGKNKANRTKNNARPSSSGRSAELLSSQMPQFVGFSGLKAFTNLSLANDDIEGSLDTKFQLVFKKISKKDSITKLKGLQEFAELIKTGEIEEVKTILPIWPRFYNILVTDPDNRVREATHILHNQIVLKAKKNLAPYLKEIMAAWFTSQYDTYPPAATAASQAFKDAFSPHKFQEAIIYCQQEIILYINENLFNQGAQILANKQSTPEEIEAKHERILLSCLHGYYLYLEKLPVENVKAITTNEEIVSNSKFWKLSKHKAVPVRSAWFKVISIICQKVLFLLKGKEAQLLSTVINNLNESEPTALPYIWECLLLAVSSIEGWWNYVSIEKMLFPKLWKLLKQGAQGNATTIYPNLLPLISHLPPSIFDSSPQFYDNFFENLRIGLQQKTIISSKSESAAVNSALLECLQYIIIKNDKNVHLCKKLIKNHLFATLELYLVEDQPGCKTLFNRISPLIQSWSKNDDLNLYCAFFFEHLVDLYDTTLCNSKEKQNYDIENICSKQVDLLQILKHRPKLKKHSKVQFSTEEDVLPDSHKKSVIMETDKKYFEELHNVVYKVSEKYVNFIEEHKTKELIAAIYSLINEFDAKNFFVCLSEYLKEKNRINDIFEIFFIFDKWLKSPTLCCKDVIDLIFLFYACVEVDQKAEILRHLVEIDNENCLNWWVSKSLSHPQNNDPLIQKWLKTDKVDKFFLDILEKEIHDQCPPELSVLLKLGLTDNENGELFVSSKAVAQIIDKLIETISHEDEFSVTIDSCTSLAAYISAVVYTENLKLHYGKSLLLCLFKFSCQHSTETETISNDTLWEVRTAWQDAVTMLAANLDQTEFVDLTKLFADILEEEFLINIFNQTLLDHLKDVIVHFLRAAYRSIPLHITDLVNTFFENELMQRNHDISKLCMLAEYVKGNLCSPFEEINDCHESNINEMQIMEYFLWVYLKVNVLTSIIEEESQDEDEDDEEEDKSTGKIIENKPTFLTVIDDVDEIVLQNVYNSTLGELYVTHYNNALHYSSNFPLEEKIKLTSKLIDKATENKLVSLLRRRALENGWIWSRTIYNYYAKYQKSTNLSSLYDSLVQDSKPDTLALLHLTQIFGKHLDFGQVFKVSQFKVIVLRHLIHCEEIEVQIAEAFGEIDKFRNPKSSMFSFQEPLARMHYIYNVDTEWQKNHEIIEIVRLCASLMSHKFHNFTKKHWDFAVLSLATWAGNLLSSRQCYPKVHFQAMASAVVDLYLATSAQIKSLEEQSSSSNYIGEWRDIFVETIHADLFQLWLFFAEQFCTQKTNSFIFAPFLQQFGKLTEEVYHEFIFKFGENMPKWSKYLKKSCTLLTNTSSTLQLWGFNMLLALVPGLAKIDENAVNTNTPHKKGLIFEQFKEKVLEFQEIVTSMLMEVKLGESTCRVEPSTDSFTYTLAYLLLWDILLTLCEKSSAEVRFQYADWLRSEEILKTFLDNLFRLLPEEMLHFSEGKAKSISDFFVKRPNMSYTVACRSEHLERYACWLYSLALAQLPAIVRQWWTGLETKVAQVVEKVTIMYVSPCLISQEMNEICQHQTKFKNMTIKVMPTVREVVAVYTVDEAQMELIISLPTNYPLGSPDVQCNRQIGGTTHKQWLLQFKKCVLHQNGRIWDGLSLWNSNLDRKFDGVEECYICFAVLHSGTYQLPKLSCQTCKKKFHSACLYKWFSTSNKSTCPICRNLF